MSRAITWKRACATFLLFWVASCNDVRFGSDPAPPVRPGSTPMATREPAPAVTQPAEPVTQEIVTEPEEPALFQLVLLSEPAPGRAPESLRHVRLEHATARSVADLVSILCIPAGPSGTVHRYSLLYPTRVEWDVAAEAAAMLDVPAVDQLPPPPPNGPLEAWRRAIGLIHGTQRGQADTLQRWRTAEAQLAHLYRAEGLSHDQRWAACMIAGSILGDRFYEYDAAEERFAQAAAVAVPGSYAQMAAIHARAQARVHQGDVDGARNLLARVLSEFDALRRTEVFDRARRLFADLASR